MSRMTCAVFAVTAAAAAAPPLAFGQAYPAKPIRMIVPYAPGGGTDLLARMLGKKMSEVFGQSVVVDNRSGAGGIIGTELAARAAADGYTLLLTSSAFTIFPAVYGKTKTPYDAVKDFAPVTLLTAQPYLMVVHPSVPASSVKEFIALAKSRPGQLNYGSGGNGTAPHLAGELLRTHIPNIRIVDIPSRYHAIQNFQPAACALELLHFAAQHDGVACHE